MQVRWRARIRLTGVNPYVIVTPRRARVLSDGRRGPLPVRVRVDGAPNPPWRVNLMPAGGGRYRLYLSGKVREASGTRVGDLVEVAVAFDPTYRPGPAHALPSSFTAGLRRSATARRNWRRLSPSRQKEVARYLAALKSPATLERNVRRALHVLRGGRARFLGRQWARGC